MFKKLLLALFIIFTITLSAQEERQPLKGRVQVGEAGLNNIFVINTTASLETKTDAAGNFSIDARPGDALVIYSPAITTREFVLKEQSFTKQPLIITVTAQAYEMEEVVFTKDRSVDEVSLGLVPKDQKQYTPAERRVFAATSGLLDPLINAISGRTKMLKNDVAIEEKQKLLEELQYIYPKEKITEELKIPAEYAEAFLYYAVEDAGLARAVKEGNDAQAKFLMSGIAEKYLKVLNDE